jgi:hypothetical protein
MTLLSMLGIQQVLILFARYRAPQSAHQLRALSQQTAIWASQL